MARFKKIYIEVTNGCNLACSFCPRSGRPRQYLTPAAFSRVLDDIQAHTNFICLHVLGEPLLHPDLAQLLAHCQAHGLQVNLTTNGTLLAGQQRTLLTAPALRQINFSLHSLAGVAAADQRLAEILAFVREASRTTRLFLSLRLWNLQAGGAAAARAADEALAWNDRLLAQLTAAFGVPPLRAEDLAAARGLALAPRVFLNPEPQFTWPHPSAPDLGGQGYCRGLRDHLAILVDGTVVPCCLDGEGRLALGNIFQFTLAEILAAPRARRMAEGFGHQRLVEPLCRRCTYRLRFAPPPPALRT